MIRRLVAGLALALLAGCQTVPKEPVALPAVMEPYFKPCAPADGASSITLLEGEALKGSAEVGWVARQGGSFDVDVLNPLSQTLLRVSRGTKSFRLKGPLVASLPEVKVREDGFFEVDGHFVGLKAAELPCLLGFRFPETWRGKLVRLTSSEIVQTAHFEDEGRDLRIRVYGAGRRAGPSRACAVIDWTRLFGLVGSKVTYCTEGDKRRSASLRGLGDYVLRWVSIDES